MSFNTKVEGLLVGKGPSVSELVTVQLLDELPLVLPVVVVLVVVGVTSSLVQEIIIGATAIKPRLDKPLLKNSFLSMCLVMFSERVLTLDGKKTQFVGRIVRSIGK